MLYCQAKLSKAEKRIKPTKSSQEALGDIIEIDDGDAAKPPDSLEVRQVFDEDIEELVQDDIIEENDDDGVIEKNADGDVIEENADDDVIEENADDVIDEEFAVEEEIEEDDVLEEEMDESVTAVFDKDTEDFEGMKKTIKSIYFRKLPVKYYMS